MKTNVLKFLIVISAMVVLNSCLWNEEETDPSTNPSFYSLVFAENDSIPNIEDADFSLVFDTEFGDSVIVNVDSLPYQTRIDSVNPTFTFMSTYYAYLLVRDSLETGVDTVYITGTDTIDFRRVISVTNIAANGKDSTTYRIKVNVHQVEPELYVWNREVNQVYTHDGEAQKAVFFGGKFYFYVSTGYRHYLYVSSDAVGWSSASVSGLPLHANLWNIMAFGNKLYYVHEDGVLYSTADGQNWIAEDPAISGYSLENLLFVLENNLWALVQNTTDKQYHFAMSSDGSAWNVGNAIPDGFPVEDYAALAFKSRTQVPKAIVLGGYNASGVLLKDAWSVQRNVYNEYKWVNFGVENLTLDTLKGASLINYDDKLLLFGGVGKDDTVNDSTYLESLDEGLTWNRADTTYNVIYDSVRMVEYAPRSYQSVILNDNTHHIYLIGGREKEQIFSDVWVGKLNRLSFEIQD